MAKSERICPFCNTPFHNGNKLRKHVKVMHPQPQEVVQNRRTQLREYRKAIVLGQMRKHGN